MADYWCEEENAYKMGNGVYADPNWDGGYVTGWLLIALTRKNVKDTYHAGTHLGWIILGTYGEHGEPYEDFFGNHLEYKDDECEEEFSSEEVQVNYRVARNKWRKFLLDEVVRLAEEKGLVPEETELMVCKSEPSMELCGRGQDKPKEWKR